MARAWTWPFSSPVKRVVDQPVAVDPRLAGELGRHHEYAEMALARAGRALVARMHMRLVDHVEPGRPERDHQFLSDCRRDRHSGSCPFRNRCATKAVN